MSGSLTGSEDLIIRSSEKYALSGLGDKNMRFCIASLSACCVAIL